MRYPIYSLKGYFHSLLINSKEMGQGLGFGLFLGVGVRLSAGQFRV